METARACKGLFSPRSKAHLSRFVRRIAYFDQILALIFHRENARHVHGDRPYRNQARYDERELIRRERIRNADGNALCV